MDRIKISDLAVHYHVGVPDEERSTAQRLLLTLEIGADFSEAAGADDISKTIDYDRVSRRLLKFGEGRSWKLIETLAVEIAEMLRREFGAKSVTVEIKKFVLPDAAYVSVRVSRQFEPAD